MLKYYRSEAEYMRKHPKTGEVEQTQRCLEMWASNVQVIETELRKQIKLDEPIGKIKMVTRRIQK
jgi:hypothetical protein